MEWLDYASTVHIPGALHIVHNIVQDILEHMSSFALAQSLDPRKGERIIERFETSRLR